MFGADVTVLQAIAFFVSVSETCLVSGASGSSTEVEIFSRSSVRPSISLRIDSMETWRAGKSARSGSCLRASGPAAGAPARLPELQTVTLRSERRKLLGALFQCSVRTFVANLLADRRVEISRRFIRQQQLWFGN
jgi:hypothetical protein